MNKLQEKLAILKQDWSNFQSNPDNQKIRIRDAAAQLGVSEAELLSTEINNESTAYLKIDDMSKFFNSLSSMDRIMFLIRNNHVVHEKTVDCQDISIDVDFIYIKNKTKDILLKFDLISLSHVFFQKKMHSGRQLRSFQFFNNNGDSVLKVYLKGKTEQEFDEIAHKYISDYRYELQKMNGDFLPLNIVLDIPLLDESSILKEESILNSNTLRKLLNKASDTQKPIQIHGLGLNAIQYHRDIVEKIVDYGPWLNVIDKNFNIHILEKGISKTILFKYSQNNKEVYSIECFDSNNNHLLGICV